VEWLPYDLHPEYPPEGIERARLAARYGFDPDGPARRLAVEAGLPYAPPERIPRSRRALELAEWARAQDGHAHARLHERVMDAYWVEGRDISDWAVLAACADEVDLDGRAGRAAAESGAHAEAVDASTAYAQRHGIMGIPAFVFGGRVLVSGAVPHETLQAAIDRLHALPD